MNEHERVAFVFAQTVCAQAEIFGMHAENMQRQQCGNSMAFVYDDFVAVLNRYGIDHNSVITYIQGR